MSARDKPARYSDAPAYRCTCGKLAYYDRAAAKRALRRLPDRSGHLNAYPCRSAPDAWHVGALPRAVVTGRATRDDVHVAPRPATDRRRR